MIKTKTCHPKPSSFWFFSQKIHIGSTNLTPASYKSISLRFETLKQWDTERSPKWRYLRKKSEDQQYFYSFRMSLDEVQSTWPSTLQQEVERRGRNKQYLERGACKHKGCELAKSESCLSNPGTQKYSFSDQLQTPSTHHTTQEDRTNRN